MKKDVENLKANTDSIALIENIELKTALENYSTRSEYRLSAYIEFRDDNSDKLQMLLTQSDDLIYPSIITLIDNFKIDANYELKKEYDFIKSNFKL